MLRINICAFRIEGASHCPQSVTEFQNAEMDPMNIIAVSQLHIFNSTIIILVQIVSKMIALDEIDRITISLNKN